MPIASVSLYGLPESPLAGRFLYVLKACLLQSGRKYPKRVQWKEIGYFDSFEKAETYLQEYAVMGRRDKEWDKDLHHLEIEKVSMNTELSTGLGYWVYTKQGMLLQAYPDISAPFMGVKPESLPFERKEIVEVLSRERLELAVILTLPPSPEAVERIRKRAGEYAGIELTLGESDYVYNTLFYREGITPENIVAKRGDHFYEHTSFLRLFPLSKPVTPGQQQALEDLYAFYHASPGS